MNTKLLIGLAVALGLVVLAFVGTRIEMETLEPEVERELVGGGHFVLERDGAVLLDETYTLLFHPVDGYMLLSQSVLTAGDQAVSLSQQTQYDRDFLPIFYHLAADTSTGPQIVSAQMGVTGLTMEIRVGTSRQAVEIPATEDLALLDNNLIGPYAVLLMAIRAEALDREFTAAIPQALLSLPGKVNGPNSIAFRSGDDTFEGKRFDLSLGDIDLYIQPDSNFRSSFYRTDTYQQ